LHRGAALPRKGRSKNGKFEKEREGITKLGFAESWAINRRQTRLSTLLNREET
jgi:hypothetical protein